MNRSRIRTGRRDREREVRRQITLLILVVMSVCLFVASRVIVLRAQEQTEEEYYKYYTSIQLQQGDTLWSLADTYADEHFSSREAFIKEVCRTNHLLEDSLEAGDYLIIPYYSSEWKQ